MSDLPDDSTVHATQHALGELAANRADDTALDTLASSEVLLPAPEGVEETDPQAVTLPVLEQDDGAQLVPVFTTPDRMHQALPQIHRYHRVPLGALAQGWPSDELSLAIDAGAPEEVTLTGGGVRTLLTRPGR
ncbi:SseB family protein [Streptomyces milbemycinicus]|uniref:SseB family protein n=1 Tax=Streptomyces milbemycinicus TaxID=476552 RepID=A0ABW8M2J0_9ACTN